MNLGERSAASLAAEQILPRIVADEVLAVVGIWLLMDDLDSLSELICDLDPALCSWRRPIPVSRFTMGS